MDTKVFGIFIIIGAVIVVGILTQVGMFSNLHLPTFPTSTPAASGGNGSGPVSERPSGQPMYEPPPEGLNSSGPDVSDSDIPEGYTREQLSPYFHKVRLGAVGTGEGLNQIALEANLEAGEQVNITGWYMKALRGGQYVPKAIETYEPLGLTAESDIFLEQDERLTIYSSVSAIGKNLRLNKCLGYLTDTIKFEPQIWGWCPELDRSEISGFTGVCQNYIYSLGSCGKPDSDPPVPLHDFACREYLQTINYSGCFKKHWADADFLSNEWWAWSGSKFLDFFHDRILLLDRQGLVVDEYKY